MVCGLCDTGDDAFTCIGDTFFLECFGHFGNELKQSESSIDETVALARLLGKGRNIVAGEIEQPFKALYLILAEKLFTRVSARAPICFGKVAHGMSGVDSLQPMEVESLHPDDRGYQVPEPY
jgi:hypothetical protein